ncbi:MAG: hypothetical protein VYE73_00940 [Acidobacteriota bacterium]|nr:hypothetical protein [Acidobacteriota bacterium]
MALAACGGGDSGNPLGGGRDDPPPPDEGAPECSVPELLSGESDFWLERAKDAQVFGGVQNISDQRRLAEISATIGREFATPRLAQVGVRFRSRR